MNIKETPTHVLLPKSTGLHHSLTTLHSDVEYLFDFTVGYSGLTAKDVPYYSYLIDNVFFRGIYPKEVHVHIQRIPVSSIPGVHTATPETPITDKNKEDFSVWLRNKFMEKDKALSVFFETGTLDPESKAPKKVVPIEADVQDWVVAGIAWYVGLKVLLPIYLSFAWSLISIVFYLFGTLLSFVF